MIGAQNKRIPFEKKENITPELARFVNHTYAKAHKLCLLELA